MLKRGEGQKIDYIRSNHIVSAIVNITIVAILCVFATLYWAHWARAPFEHEVIQPSPRELQWGVSRFEESTKLCAQARELPPSPDPQMRQTNPRWQETTGQAVPVILRNATLFDGETVYPEPMDIIFEKGLVISVRATADHTVSSFTGTHDIYNVHGRFVTPGLVDMHSHHSASPWPHVEEGLDDINEMGTSWGPMTPFVRTLDSLRAYDRAFEIIASGGVTSSLVLPGSSNIMAGEAFPVKNARFAGQYGEPVVEEVLLESGVPADKRRRYMKLACGENPKTIYGHTRMGNAWLLREQLAKARRLLDLQEDYCVSVSALESSSPVEQYRFIQRKGNFPTELALESTIGLLRGQVDFHNHCYLPEDMETMIRVASEQKVKIKAFHHATEAWQVSHMLRNAVENLTLAIFAEFSLYKWESYSPNLGAGNILANRGISVAYKSDHGLPELNAKYLMYQAASGHAHGLDHIKALQAVTSVPANALGLGYRVGYSRKGYDADIVVWDAHPLSIGATPLQVFIDGRAQLDSSKVKHSTGQAFSEADFAGRQQITSATTPSMRPNGANSAARELCDAKNSGQETLIINGIERSFLKYHSLVPIAEMGPQKDGPSTLIIRGGKVACFGAAGQCMSKPEDRVTRTLNLTNGSLTPGFTTVTASLGLTDMALEFGAGNGMEDPRLGATRPENIDFAKFGVQLEGKAFARARMGGITRAISPPIYLGGFLHGVSTGIRTDTSLSLSNGGIFQPDVALHITLDTSAKATYGTMSKSVMRFRQMLAAGESTDRDTVLGRVANGTLPLVVHANNHWDIQQIISIKQDYPKVNIVLLGGSESPLVAPQLRASNVSVILTENRPAPEEFRHRDAVVGPPLTPSVARQLSEAGVNYAIAVIGSVLPVDFRLHALALEASWTAKYSGLDENEAISLVTHKVEDILGLDPTRDLVVWEGSPLDLSGAVALTLSERHEYDGSVYGRQDSGYLEVTSCWPTEFES